MKLQAGSQEIQLKSGMLGLAAAVLFCAPMAVAGETSDRPLSDHVSGAAFGTLGIAYNASRDVEFVRNLSQPDGARDGFSLLPDTILGAQLKYRPSPQWELVLQAISKYDYREKATPTVSWAYVGYSPSPLGSLRLGRIGVDSYLDSDTRNVGFSYLPARRPIEHYGLLELTWIEGADFTLNTSLAGGILTAKAYAGVAGEKIVDREQQRYSLDDSRVVGGYLQQQWGELRLRSGISSIRLQQENSALVPLLAGLSALGTAEADRLAGDLALENTWIRNWSTSLAWNRGALQTELHYNRRRAESRGLADGYSAYALAGYRFGAVTPFIGYVTADSESSRRNYGFELPEPVEFIFRSALYEQRSWQLGARYDFANKAALTLQLDRVDAPIPEGALLRQSRPGWNGDATVISLTLDFIL
ncbi:hypothetical protein Q6D67_14030 [Haliea sp. E1-2-M8]|uniref:hypothetical protein n=1 Tax=Haliea sp. E1-2-M8 TaxID=3064706 RepID=UPI0027204565|nr:hypothetical protein [Haliea sp. E1-2-M8]MDO8862825.1 hypothetical protein [Haliea sp. E1-2-M8]